MDPPLNAPNGVTNFVSPGDKGRQISKDSEPRVEWCLRCAMRAESLSERRFSHRGHRGHRGHRDKDAWESGSQPVFLQGALLLPGEVPDALA